MNLPAGVHRLGDRHVNFYLIEDGTDLTLVDTGLPGHWRVLTEALAGLGRSVGDIAAVLITHGHVDHFGLANRIRTEAGAQVWVHPGDAPILHAPRRTRRTWRPERSLFPYAVTNPRGLVAPWNLVRRGGLLTAATPEVHHLRDGQRLDVPGNPLVVHTPGHTAGSTTFLLPGPAIAFTGDTLVTHDEITGHFGPTLLCRALTQDSDVATGSLTTLAELDADLVLPGHGDPWPHGLASAAQQARTAGIR